MLKFLLNGISFLFLLLIVYLSFPTETQFLPREFTVEVNRTNELAENDLLTNSVPLTTEIEGPEDIEFDKEGNLYTGGNDGIIWKVSPKTGKKEKFVRTLGRPLGLRFDKDGNLIVTDAYFGLLSIDKQKQVTQLCSETEDGKKINFADFLDISTRTGEIYFSDASEYQLHETSEAVISGIPTGRIIKYDPNSGKCVTVLDKLFFANGVVLIDNEDALLISETSEYKITKFYLKGPNKGKRETWLHLPGYPDNIHRGSNGVIRISVCEKTDFFVKKIVQPFPFVKQFLTKLLKLINFVPLKNYGLVVEVNEKTGKIIKCYEDKEGKVLSQVTTAAERDGYLYLGSYKRFLIAKYKLF